MAIKPIETIYNGYRFRSRLEARWAVFFDALGIEYEYESQGFNLGEAGWYLPDFWLPKQECWIEIKPVQPDAIEEDRMSALVKGSGKDGFIFWGPVPYPDDAFNLSQGERDSAYAFTFCKSGSYEGDESYVGWDNFYKWCECRWCGLLGIEFDGRAARLACQCHERAHERGECNCNGDKDYNIGSARLLQAYTAARQARFEHGG